MSRIKSNSLNEKYYSRSGIIDDLLIEASRILYIVKYNKYNFAYNDICMITTFFMNKSVYLVKNTFITLIFYE